MRLLNFLKNSQLILLGTILFAIPLVFDLNSYNIFELPKAVWLEILVSLLFISWLVEAVLKQKIELTYHKNELAIMGLLLIAQLISCALSVNPAISFWGSYWRQQGLWLWLYYLAFFYLIRQILKDRKIYSFNWPIVVASSLVGFYGLCQLVGLDLISWQEPPLITHRVFSFMGQPNFLGGWLILVWPLAAWQFWQRKKILWLAILILNFILIFFTFSRTVWLAVAVQIFILILLWLRSKKLIKIFYSLLILAATGLIGYFILSFQANKVASLKAEGQQTIVEQMQTRVKTAVNWRYGSLASRALFWQAGFSAIKQAPLWGFGQDTQNLVLSKYYSPEIAIHEAINTVPDRAHNGWLDTLLTVGWLGWLAWLGAAIGLIFLLRKFFLSDQEVAAKKYVLAILIGWVGYLIFDCFNFATVAINLNLWFGFAVIAAAAPAKSIKINLNFSNSFKTFLLIFLIVLASWLVYFAGQQLVIDDYFLAAKKAQAANQYSWMMDKYEKIFFLSPRQTYYNWQFAGSVFSYVDVIKEEPARRELLDLAYDLAARSAEFGADPSATFVAAKAQALLGYYMDESFFPKAEALFFATIKLAPQMAKFHLEQGKMYLWWKKYELAKVSFLTALRLTPNLSDPRLNYEHQRLAAAEVAEIHEWLGQAEFFSGNYDSAIVEYLKAQSLNPTSLAWKKLADAYYKKGDFKKAYQAMAHLAILQPANLEWQREAKMLYNEAGKQK